MSRHDHGGTLPFPLSARDTPSIWHGLRVTCAPSSEPPFAVDAWVVEDDTWQVLGADPDFTAAAEHPIRLMRALREAEPLEPGSVFAGDGIPTRLKAIVHDLDCEPSWRETWIAEALAAIFGLARERSWRAIAIPLLGMRYGRLPTESALELLGRALAERPAQPLERLWILV